jgi:hypothetical protein
VAEAELDVQVPPLAQVLDGVVVARPVDLGQDVGAEPAVGDGVEQACMSPKRR